MAIQLSKEYDQAIRAYGEETFPNECCGFMLGMLAGDTREVVELLPANNDRDEENKYNRFLITPDDFMKGERAARKKGLDILGFYHSHPNAPARPSQYDLDHALPWYSYVIISVTENAADVMTSWILAEDRSAFEEESIQLSD